MLGICCLEDFISVNPPDITEFLSARIIECLLVLPKLLDTYCVIIGAWNNKFLELFKCKGNRMLGICQCDKLWAVSMPYGTMNQILHCFSLFIWSDTYSVTIGA